jgi:hypothetical protein
MGCAHDTGQSRAQIDIDRGHQIQTQQRQVGEIVSRQIFTAEMRVHASQSAKTIRRHAHALEIRKLNPARVSDGHVFNVAFAID